MPVTAFAASGVRMEREFLSLAEVAAMFQCHPETVKRMSRRGLSSSASIGSFPTANKMNKVLAQQPWRW
jgi:hypothetical protein